MHGQSIKSWRLLFKMKLPHLKVNGISYTTCKIILLISINETQLVEEMSDVDSLLLFDHWKSDIFIVQWIILVIFAPLSTVTSTYLRRHTNINHTVLFCLELPVFSFKEMPTLKHNVHPGPKPNTKMGSHTLPPQELFNQI